MRILFLSLLLSATFLPLSSLRAETLDNAVETALKTHPSVEAAQEAIEVIKEERSEQVSKYFPQLSVGATGGRIFGDNSTTRGLVTNRGQAYSYLWEGTLSARQVLFDGFEIGSRVDSANARKLSSQQSLMDVRENLAFNTVQSYIDLLRAQKGIVMILAQMKKVDDYAYRIQQGVDDGVMDAAELQQAVEVKTSLESFLAQYRGQEAAAKAQYEELTGTLPNTDLENPRPNVEMIFETALEASDYALVSHPSVRAAHMSIKSADYDVDAEQAALYPKFNGELSYLKSDKREEIGGELEDGRAVLRMNWDFETGMGQYSRINQRRHSKRESQARLRTIKKQIKRGIDLSYAEYETATELLSNQTKRVRLAQDLFDTYEIQFEAAVVRLLDLMRADNQYFSLRLEQMNGAHRALLAQFAILASVGRLRESFDQTLAYAE